MVEADLQHHYGLDLRDEFDEAGCRRLWVLVNGLPPDAATWRVDGQQWTTLHELLALNAEVTDRWGLANAQLKSTKKLNAKPLRVPRPSDPRAEPERKDRVVTDVAEIAAWFG